MCGSVAGHWEFISKDGEKDWSKDEEGWNKSEEGWSKTRDGVRFPGRARCSRQGAMGAMWSGCCCGLGIGSQAKGSNNVVVIVGPSGVGKSTLISRLMEDYKGRFGFSVSHTTRKPREGEVDGVHYNFTTTEKMREDISKGAFIEHAEVHGNFYGTSIEAVNTVRNSGKVCLLDIDVQGAQQMKKSSLNQDSAYMFVAPPSVETLEERLRGRGTESEEKILLRLENARKELAFAQEQPSFFGTVIVNDKLERAYAQFRSFIQSRCGQFMGSPTSDT